MSNGRRIDTKREIGHDGISAIMDADRALRVREICHADLPEQVGIGTLLQRIEGQVHTASFKELKPSAPHTPTT